MLFSLRIFVISNYINHENDSTFSIKGIEFWAQLDIYIRYIINKMNPIFKLQSRNSSKDKLRIG
jgi:hypothetical protein